MKVIADSGSTKTLWRIYSNKRLSAEIKTQGLNPSGMKAQDFEERMTGFDYWSESIHEVFFYGAGCSGKGKATMEELLAEKFPKAHIHVESDLLGSARGLCGDKPGYVGILGTGSNACLYDGNKILDQRGGHGYILNDKGGGFSLGQKLLVAYLDNKLPQDLRSRLEESYSISPNGVVTKIYNSFQPNRYIASLSHFIYENINHPFLTELVKDRFKKYFENTFQDKSFYKEGNPIFLTGSVAVVYADLLRQVAKEMGLKIQGIEKSPMDGLQEYHHCVEASDEHEQYN